MDSGRPPTLDLAELEQAAGAGDLYLAYQPKLDLGSGRISGVEALARWLHPRHGLIEPSHFIPVTEKSGLIDWFSDWALSAALSQWSGWRDNGLDLELAVNISALNLQHLGFPNAVRDLCTRQGVPPDRLTLELTEGATQKASCLMDTISRFRLMGIGISLDDFGTGYGSLVQLRSLPFTELKIDRRFVCDLLLSRDSRAITRGLITMAHEIGMTVTAEGVEDLATLEALTVFGCDKAQGFLIGRPMRGKSLSGWIRAWTPGGMAGMNLRNDRPAGDGGSDQAFARCRGRRRSGQDASQPNIFGF